MPSYLTSVGVQQVSITIPNGSSSATATITAVGALAFILSGQSSGPATPANAQVRVTLTNSTTVTATRVGTTGVAVWKGSVVDATSDLVASVQFGTVTITATNTSSTAAISAVSANTAALVWLGTSNGDGTSLPSTQHAALSYAGTTVTATLGAAAASTTVVSFCMIEFAAAALNSNVQVFSTAWSNAVTSTTQTITSVSTTNSILIWGGESTTDAGGLEVARQRATLTNATTVTINIGTAGTGTNTYNFTVVEFAAGVLSQAVQRGTIALNGVASNTATITSVNTTKTAAYSLGNSTTVNTAQDRANVALELTNSTTLTGTKQTSTGNSTVGYAVAEFSSGGTGSTLLLMGVG